MSRRTERVAELIREEISRIIVTELNDPRISFVTVTRVEVSPDLSLAKVFVSVMDTLEKAQVTLRGLNSARKRMRLAIGQEIALRHMPEIAFILDSGIKRSVHISGILSDLARERAERESSEAAAAPDSEEEQTHDR